MIVTIPYPPSANRYWRIFRGRAVHSKAATDYKKAIRSMVESEPTDEPVQLAVILHPKQNKDGSECKTIIDLDNCLKVALDALQGVAYLNDKQVRKITAEYGDPLPDGGLTVTVSTITMVVDTDNL